ncbi:RNA polymerase sigma factor [Granulicella sibirica]|uniref:RNA polymerase sigma factor n=1 Tax=Granulicella sibirica TaxID=2479048 RepID=A0A4V1L5P3_9BACT|nr:RNA polymerase sigma factor [Granulicella sibirica]RXH56464.1 RNA polymerase, sigma-24 subunit, ECF subfamily [Granulicella sibirica]
MELTDQNAIDQVLSGDRDAYRTLMDRHFQYVFRIAFRITGNESDAEDVAQESFLRAYNKLSTFRHDATFSTWISRIAMNTAINLIERRKRDLTERADRIADEPTPEEQTRQIPDHKAGPERLLLDSESTTIRQAAMDSLTPMERTAFTLRHMEELPIAEIATALNIPANSAKQAVFRAVGKLRRALAPTLRPLTPRPLTQGGTR